MSIPNEPSVVSVVGKFARACGFNTPTQKIVWDKEQVTLLKALIDEEKKELDVAFDKVQDDPTSTNLNELLDGICDLVWVSIKLALVTGLPFNLAWCEVARSNLEKISPDGSVIKNASGKVMKPEGWRAPDFISHIRSRL